ncbi:hypothetical protein Plhal304r1_c076g0163891 [Plasmopara halstedii]
MTSWTKYGSIQRSGGVAHHRPCTRLNAIREEPGGLLSPHRDYFRPAKH